MIGVICKTEQVPVVEEIFQLSEISRELYRQSHHYDVVLSTTEGVLAVNAGLLVLLGSDKENSDAWLLSAPGSRGLFGDGKGVWWCKTARVLKDVKDVTFGL